MEENKPLVSVVVCTHNRASDALECVRAVAEAHRIFDIEIIVVDNASDEQNRALLEKGVQDMPVRFIVEPRPGLSIARNRGLELTAASWVAYLDDDAVPAPDWVDRALSIATRASDDIGFVAGAVFPRWPDKAPVDAVQPAGIGSRWRDLLSLLETERWLPESAHPMVVGCNMLINATTLRDIGGFPEQLGRTPERLLGGEETAVARACVAAGRKVMFDGRLRVDHKIHAERLRLEWVRRRAAAEGALLWSCDRRWRVWAKAALSLPVLVLLHGMHRVSGRTPARHDAYVRLWHNIGFVRSALRASTQR